MCERYCSSSKRWRQDGDLQNAEIVADIFVCLLALSPFARVFNMMTAVLFFGLFYFEWKGKFFIYPPVTGFNYGGIYVAFVYDCFIETTFLIFDL